MGFESVDSMADLLDMDCAGKGCLLSIVTLKLERAYVRGLGLIGQERHT